MKLQEFIELGGSVITTWNVIDKCVDSVDNTNDSNIEPSDVNNLSDIVNASYENETYTEEENIDEDSYRYTLTFQGHLVIDHATEEQAEAILDHFEEILKCNPNCDASEIDPDFNAFLDKFYQNHQDLFEKLEAL